MKKIRRVAVVSAAVAAALAFGGCASGAGTTSGSAGSETNQSAEGGKDDLFIGMAFQEMNNEYFVVMQEAFVDACESIGARHIETDAAHDVTKQVGQVEDMIEQGIDILIVNPADTAGIEAAVQKAHDAGVVVVAVDADANGPKDVYVTSENYDAGYLAGEQMVADLNGEGQVALLDGIPTDGILNRVKGFKDAIAKAPGIVLVDTQNGKQERDVALGVVENMLSANPDLDAIFSVNDTGSLGALAAVKAAGRDTLIYSVDGAPEAVEAIKDGGNFRQTSAQFPRDMVRIGLGMGLAKYWGASVVPEYVPIGVESIMEDEAADFGW